MKNLQNMSRKTYQDSSDYYADEEYYPEEEQYYNNDDNITIMNPREDIMIITIHL